MFSNRFCIRNECRRLKDWFNKEPKDIKRSFSFFPPTKKKVSFSTDEFSKSEGSIYRSKLQPLDKLMLKTNGWLHTKSEKRGSLVGIKRKSFSFWDGSKGWKYFYSSIVMIQKALGCHFCKKNWLCQLLFAKKKSYSIFWPTSPGFFIEIMTQESETSWTSCCAE